MIKLFKFKLVKALAFTMLWAMWWATLEFLRSANISLILNGSDLSFVVPYVIVWPFTFLCFMMTILIAEFKSL